MFFHCFCFVYFDHELKTEGQTIYRKPDCKVTKLSPFLGWLNCALNNPVKEAWLNLYSIY